MKNRKKIIKDSYFAEILTLLLAGISGIMIYNGKIIISICGYVLLGLDSYFIVTKLKEFTVKEYLEEIKEKE